MYTIVYYSIVYTTRAHKTQSLTYSIIYAANIQSRILIHLATQSLDITFAHSFTHSLTQSFIQSLALKNTITYLLSQTQKSNHLLPLSYTEPGASHTNHS